MGERIVSLKLKLTDIEGGPEFLHHQQSYSKKFWNYSTGWIKFEFLSKSLTKSIYSSVSKSIVENDTHKNCQNFVQNFSFRLSLFVWF